MTNDKTWEEEFEEICEKGVPMGDGVMMENRYLKYAKEQLYGFIKRQIEAARKTGFEEGVQMAPFEETTIRQQTINSCIEIIKGMKKVEIEENKEEYLVIRHAGNIIWNSALEDTISKLEQLIK